MDLLKAFMNIRDPDTTSRVKSSNCNNPYDMYIFLISQLCLTSRMDVVIHQGGIMSPNMTSHNKIQYYVRMCLAKNHIKSIVLINKEIYI